MEGKDIADFSSDVSKLMFVEPQEVAEETVFPHEGGLAAQQCLGLWRTVLCLISPVRTEITIYVTRFK